MWSKQRSGKLMGALDGAQVLGISVVLLGLSWSEAAKSLGLALAVLAFLLRLALGGRAALPQRRALFFLALYCGAAALSIALAPARLSRPGELLTIAITVLPFVVVQDVCARGPSRRVLFAYLLVAGAALGSLMGYIEHLTGEYIRLVLPSIENAIPAGEFLAAMSALIVAMLLVEYRATLAGPAMALSLGLCVLTLLMTRSRGPFLGAAGGGFLAALLGPFRRWTLPLACLALVAGVTFFAVANPRSRVVRDSVLNSRSAVNRVKTWRAAVDLFRERPVVGHGAGSFALLDVQFVDDVGVEWEQNAHNVLLHELVETGLLGAGALVCFVVFGVRGVVRGLRAARWRLERAICAGSLAGVVALLVCGFFSVSFDAEPGILLFTLLALGGKTGIGAQG